MDDRNEFESRQRSNALRMGADSELADSAKRLFCDSDQYDYSYQWSWLGIPIIQIPPDIVALQEIIWASRPQIIVETGIARGGSAIFLSSMLELVGEGTIVSIDVDIRPHNRAAIESHVFGKRIQMIEGSSVDPRVLEQVRKLTEGADRVMVILDSNHTHQHVLHELTAYAPLVTQGQYLVVADTIIDYIPEQGHRPRPWGPGNNPRTALEEFLPQHPEFEPDEFVNAKLLLTSSPGGYLRRSR